VTTFDDRLLRPDLDDPHGSPFWHHCHAGELRIQACTGCGRLRHPPRPMCPWCQSTAHEWRRMSGRGRVWSFVNVHPPLLAAYGEHAPYNAIVVELDEDSTIRLVGNLVSGPEGALEEIDADTIEIGEPVEVCFQQIAEDVTLPRWRRPS
jgi:hypothetical protein